MSRRPVNGFPCQEWAGGDSVAVLPRTTGEVTPQVAKILLTCEGESDREGLQARTGLKDREHFRTEYLRPAISQGLIEMTLPDKPQSSKQRYRLTEVGQQWLDENRPSD